MTKQTICIYSPLIGYGLHTYLRDEIDRLSHTSNVVVVALVVLEGGWEPSCPVFASTRLREDELAPDSGWDSQIVTNYTGIPEKAMTTFAENCSSGVITAFLKEHNVTGVLAQWLHETCPLLDIAKELSVPYVVRTHGTDIAAGLMDAEVKREYAHYNDATAILVGSQYAAELVAQLGVSKGLLRVASFGMAVASEVAAPMNDANRVNVLCVSRVERMKGSIFSLEGFRKAAAKDSRLFLNIVGDGSLLAAMKQLTQAFKLEDRVKFWGRLPNKGPELRKLWLESDIFLQSSVSVADESSIETFGVSVLEALSYGLPTIVSNSQALPEMVVPGESGIIVPAGDADAISEALLALASSPENARNLGRGALERVRYHYSAENQCRTVLEAFGFGV